MANPDPPPNSLGLDIVQSEPASDAQSTLANPPSPSPQPTTQSLGDATNSVATDTAASPTTPAPTTDTDEVDKVDDATKPNVSKKTPYVNPERVKTGGLPRDKLTDEELAERMARMREQNEKIKQRRLDVAADEDAFKQTQAAERQRQAQIRKVQETINRTREQNARKKLGGIQSREWDSDKKTEGWSTTEKPEAPSSASTTRTNTGDRSEEPEASEASPASPTVKPRGDKRGRGFRGRGRGRGSGRGRGDKAPTNNIGDPPLEPEKVEEGK
ncbi:hypothetical protein F5888DRAFT_1664399 [Russula emetica]|nr:hypothetical protein F5888DRAFT_1664399 [Russula emetica]